MSKYIYTAAYIGVIVAANWATSTFGLVSLGLLGRRRQPITANRQQTRGHRR